MKNLELYMWLTTEPLTRSDKLTIHSGQLGARREIRRKNIDVTYGTNDFFFEKLLVHKPMIIVYEIYYEF